MEFVRCNGCNQTFDDATTLLVHQQFDSCHEQVRCPLCDQGFADSQLVEIHFNEVHDRSSSQRTTADPFAEQLADRQKRMRTRYERDRDDEVQSPIVEDEDAMIARLLQEEEDAQSFQQFQVTFVQFVGEIDGLFRIDTVRVRERSKNERDGIWKNYFRRN